ncbi:MAG TPA: TauD/TfdA family dioxygenase [Rhodopila sp.]
MSKFSGGWGREAMVEVVPSGAALGAEIVVDLAGEIDEAMFRAVEAAFHEHIVVVFRGQRLSSAQQIAFSRRFGELEVHIVRKYLLAGFPEILLVSNIRDAAG